MKFYIPTLPDAEYTDKTETKKVLLTDFHFEIDGVPYVISKGFVWDGASIPWVMRWKYGTPFDPVHLVGGLVHDAIYGDEVEYGDAKHTYRGAPCLADFTRLQADNIYYSLIRKFGAVMLRAFKEWGAVRIFGRSHWTKR